MAPAICRLPVEPPTVCMKQGQPVLSPVPRKMGVGDPVTGGGEAGAADDLDASAKEERAGNLVACSRKAVAAADLAFGT